MLRSLVLLSALALAPASVHSQVITLNIDAERLDDQNGNPMPATGLVVAVADRNEDDYGPVTTDWFASGDDFVFGSWQIQNSLGNGVFESGTFSVTLENGLDAGDPFKLMWFPTLTTTNVASIPLGTPYGEYKNDPTWVFHSVGLASFAFVTEDADGGGTVGVSGDATLTVVPEPSTYAAVFGLACLGWAVAKRRIKAGS